MIRKVSPFLMRHLSGSIKKGIYFGNNSSRCRAIRPRQKEKNHSDRFERILPDFRGKRRLYFSLQEKTKRKKEKKEKRKRRKKRKDFSRRRGGESVETSSQKGRSEDEPGS